jgi:hypothetical protein
MVLMAGFKKSYSAISPLCMRIRNCFVFSYVKDKVNALCSTSQTWRTHFFTTKDTKFTKRRVYATFLPTFANSYVKDKVNALCSKKQAKRPIYVFVNFVFFCGEKKKKKKKYM